MATIINSAAASMMIGWKCHSKVLALPCSPKQPLLSPHIPSSLKFNNFYYNHFSSKLLSKAQSHAIHTTAPNTTSSSLQEEEKDHVKINYCGVDLFAADQRLTMSNSSAGSCRRKFVDMLSRILASLLTYGIGFTFITMVAFLYASNSALASSYGSMGGSSSYSSSSSSDDDDDSSYYYYESSANKTCTCDTSCTQCTDCDIKKEGYKQEKRYDNPCSCNCHGGCFFHKEINPVIVFINAITALIQLSLTLYVIIGGAINAYSERTGTLLIFQVGVSDKQRVLQRKLNKIAENADTSTLEGLNYVLKETVRALPQQDNSDHLASNYYSYMFEKYDTKGSLSKDLKEVLDKFDKFVKDEEVFVNVDGVKYQKKAGMVKAKRGIDNEYTLATICVLASSKHRTPIKREEKGEYVDFFAVLQTLQRIPKDDIRSVRVMWTPQKEDEILTEEDLRRQTNLIPIVNGRVFLIS